MQYNLCVAREMEEGGGAWGMYGCLSDWLTINWELKVGWLKEWLDLTITSSVIRRGATSCSFDSAICLGLVAINQGWEPSWRASSRRQDGKRWFWVVALPLSWELEPFPPFVDYSYQIKGSFWLKCQEESGGNEKRGPYYPIQFRLALHYHLFIPTTPAGIEPQLFRPSNLIYFILLITNHTNTKGTSSRRAGWQLNKSACVRFPWQIPLPLLRHTHT